MKEKKSRDRREWMSDDLTKKKKNRMVDKKRLIKVLEAVE